VVWKISIQVENTR